MPAISFTGCFSRKISASGLGAFELKTKNLRGSFSLKV
jgi:hypothetical protein